jgi:hypothetical protein
MAPLYHETQWADVANAAIYGIVCIILVHLSGEWT